MEINTLEDYFRFCDKDEVIDHSVRATVMDTGEVVFYIHPATVSGPTVDFNVDGNQLSTKVLVIQ